MTREEFKKAVFGITDGKCCVPGCECDAVDACGNQKWNTRMEAMQAAKWYLETYYDYYEN